MLMLNVGVDAAPNFHVCLSVIINSAVKNCSAKTWSNFEFFVAASCYFYGTAFEFLTELIFKIKINFSTH